MAELSKLLGFMSAWDRREALIKYDALFDEAEDEHAFIESLGSPTKLAIGLALNYVPSPPPAVVVTETVEPDGQVGEFAAGAGEAEAAPEEEAATATAEEVSENAAETAEEAEAAPVEEASENGEEALQTLPEAEIQPEELQEEEPKKPARKVRAIGLIGSILFGLIIGLPIAVVLICLGIPFIALGAGLGTLAVLAALSVIGLLAMFSDVLIIVGAGLVLCALAILLIWFGFWLSFELGWLWIGGVVLRLGRAMTYKKEVAAE